jgi:hypothetical protein
MSGTGSTSRPCPSRSSPLSRLRTPSINIPRTSARPGSLHRLVRDPRPDRIAGLPGEGRRLSPRHCPR